MPFGRRRASRSPPLAPRRRGVGEAVPETDLGEEVKTLDMVWARLPFMDAGGGGGGEGRGGQAVGWSWYMDCSGEVVGCCGLGVPGGGVVFASLLPRQQGGPELPGGRARRGGFLGGQGAMAAGGRAGLRACGLESRSFLVRRGGEGGEGRVTG